MKKYNFLKRAALIHIAFLLIIGWIFFSSPHHLIGLASSSLSLEISSPEDNSKHNTRTVMFTGTVSNGTDSIEKLKLFAYVNGEQVGNVVVISQEGNWSFEKYFADGAHTVKFELLEEVANQEPNQIEKVYTINMDATRPVIQNIEFIYPVSGENVTLPVDDMTRIPIYAKILVKIVGDNLLDLSNLLSVKTSKEVPVEIIKDESNPEILTKNEFGQYEVLYRPINQWEMNSSYIVTINSTVKDAYNNSFYPKQFKFSTQKNDNPEDSHGKYLGNTKSCGNCHSTHKSDNKGLPGGIVKNSHEDLGGNFCMACHDGTTTAPKTFGLHSHKNIGNKKSDTCTSCHNPHLTWSKDNPNRLKDYYEFYHNADTGIDPPRLIMSNVELCESCHDNGFVSVKTKSHLRNSATYGDYYEFDHLGDIGIKKSYQEDCVNCHVNNMVNVKSMNYYRELAYRKSMTANGNVINDSSLCISCHDGNSENNAISNLSISNIKEFYYSKLTNPEDPEGQEIVYNDNAPIVSGHTITALDGSSFTGQIPCSDCHDTHGSENTNGLKNVIGHENSQPYSEQAEVWGYAEERKFCTKCHNSATSIYGVKAKEIIFESSPIGHDANSTESCASCHGGESKSFIEAAHSPKGTTSP
jgi:hypothetical protein